MYLAPPGYQLGPDGGRTGPVDCTAWAMSRLIADATEGLHVPTGRQIRLLTDEPVPDPESPGLNLSQVHDVAWEHFGVWTDVYTGARALDIDRYEALRRDGYPVIAQLGYGPIAASHYDAGRGFTGGHAIYESRSQTMDSLAGPKGRTGIYHYGPDAPRLYPRELMHRAFGSLVVRFDPIGRPTYAEPGKVWCAVGRDTAPDFRVHIVPRRKRHLRRVRVFSILDGRIVHYDVRTVGPAGVDAECSPPRAFRWPALDGALRFLVRVHNPDGKLDGKWVNARWADPAVDTTGGPDLDPSDDYLTEVALDDPDEPVPDVRNDAYIRLPDDPEEG